MSNSPRFVSLEAYEERGREIERLTEMVSGYKVHAEEGWRQAEEFKARLAKVVEAARELIFEYRSHGGQQTHQECSEGGRCFVASDIHALEAAIGEEVR